MTHYLKNKDNDIIVECAVSDEDITTTIHNDVYSKELIGLSVETREELVYEINIISDLNNEWLVRKPDYGYTSVDDFLDDMLSYFIKEFGFTYIAE